MKRLQLSPNFYLDEFTRSQTAARHDIDMSVTPGSEVYRNLKLLAELALQPAREALGPIFISSGYRPLLLNQKIGGSATSAHVHGLAADIAVSGHNPLLVARWFENSGIAFDQVIHEFGQWVHVGIVPEGRVPRQQLLTAVKTAKGTAYLYGIHSMPEALRRAG
jgi:hypothetical protein